MPKLFTELDPGNTELQLGLDGQPVSPISKQLALLHADIAKKTGFEIPEATQHLLSE